ncbi:hypothetical protein DRV84_09910 [Rhodosalinus sediminis]|uniref:Transposase DDE domain-containing protein n=1 Tax=Rhodosalinus sediminis TaxID=1940533 RepID=A0A3D9BS41_9RHOB|nr:hypothetical protein DRV84_09910 [Rhodosalinus sediminis]
MADWWFGRTVAPDGAVVLREVLERSGIVEWMIPQLTDPRRREDVVHDLPSLIRTSVLLAAQGWRDHDDADALRDDPAFRRAASSASGRTPLDRPHGLASQPTLSRFTAIMAEPSNRSELRKAALELGARAPRAERGGKRPRRLTLDVDSLRIEVHGHQPKPESHVSVGVPCSARSSRRRHRRRRARELRGYRRPL